MPNSVFHDMLYDKRISMRNLRKRIERMIHFITHKNDRFCLWSVLSYHNIIKDKNTEAFTRPMLSPEWFGKHLDITPFTMWNKKSYDIYREMHNKTKWHVTLCNRFAHVCYDMDEAFKEGE